MELQNLGRPNFKRIEFMIRIFNDLDTDALGRLILFLYLLVI